MKKILYVVSTLQRSGPTNVLYNLISHIDRTKYTPLILTLSDESPDHHSLGPEFFKLGVEIQTLKLSRFSGFLFAKHKILSIVRKEHIDVIHINGLRADLIINGSCFKPTKIITTINSNIYEDYCMLYGNIKGQVMAKMHMWSLKNKVAIGCSEFVSKRLNNRYNSHLRVIYNGIPKESYNIPSPNDKIKIRKEFNLPLDKNIFIFVGYLILRKNPVTVIQGFLSSNSNRDSILLIIGDGPLMAECKKHAKGSASIIFMGNQPETLRYLVASDFYVASSFSEGLPTSVMEAMGCGLPVILSEIEPHVELLSKIGQWPYKFPTTDYLTLAQNFNEIAYDNYQNLSIKCRNVIENDINADIMAQNYQKLYNQS